MSTGYRDSFAVKYTLRAFQVQVVFNTFNDCSASPLNLKCIYLCCTVTAERKKAKASH